MPLPPLRPHLTLLNISLLSTSLGLLTLSTPTLRNLFLSPTTTTTTNTTTTNTTNHRAMSSSTAPTYKTTPYHPRYPSFPYTPQDLTPSDPTSDDHFYRSPRFVTHIDDHAISTLQTYFLYNLPKSGRILDLCSSWISHFPEELEQKVEEGALQVAGVGMSAREMERNGLLKGRWKVWDLNQKPEVPGLEELFTPNTNPSTSSPATTTPPQPLLTSTTCTVSIDYLTQPLQVLRHLHTLTAPNGTIHLVISNRCFPTKAVRRWLRISEEERLQMVGDYLWFAGWRGVEMLELSDGVLRPVVGEGGACGGDVMGPGEGGGLAGFMRMMGMQSERCDPLWVVRAHKNDDDDSVNPEGGEK